MTYEEDIEKAYELLVTHGYAVIRPPTRRDLILVDHRQLLGKTLELMILDKAHFGVPEILPFSPEILPPKNKPWYQRFDKHVGKHRK